MAFLKETPRSLRTYFLLVGALTALGVVMAVGDAPSFTTAILAVAPMAVFAADFLYAGIRMPTLLAIQPRRLEHVIYAALAMDALQVVMDVVGGVTPAQAAPKGGIGVLLCLYLLANIRRLAREAVAVPRSAGLAS